MTEVPTGPGSELEVPSQGASGVVHTTPSAIEIPVAEFEGEYVRKMQGKLPGLTIDMPVGYKRGTHLRLEVEVRVVGAGVYDVKVGREAVPTRVHNLVYEDVKLLGAYTEDELLSGGSVLGDD